MERPFLLRPRLSLLSRVRLSLSHARLAHVRHAALITRAARSGITTKTTPLAAPLACLLFSLAISAGCNPPPRPELGGTINSLSVNAQLRDDDQSLVDLTRAAVPFSAPWETWQAYFIGGRHVGYNHTAVEPDSPESDSPVRVTLEDQLTIRRGNSSIVQRIDQTSLETRGGQLISFEAVLRIGPAITKYSGSVQGDELTVVTTRGSKESTQTVPWQATFRGPAGIQQSLRESPLDRGQQRVIHSLVPIRFASATSQLDCRHLASIAMPDGTQRQTREIEVSISMDDAAPMQTVIWIDNIGNVVKTYTPALDLVAFDSTREAAIEGIVASDDIFTATSITVTGSLDNPSETLRTAFRLTPRKGSEDHAETLAFQAHPGQYSRKSDNGTYDLLVSRAAGEKPPAGFQSAELRPNSDDGRSGPLINSDDPLVRQLAETAIAKKNDRPRLALELTKTVHSVVKRNSYSEGFMTAADVARAGAGDCTAHSVLLAAMLRARGIPARVAVGLVYLPTDNQPRMVYHMWTIAYVEDRWLHLDATLGGGYAAADRITLGTHNLAGGNEYDAVTPIIGAIGRFDVEIIKANTGSLDQTPQ